MLIIMFIMLLISSILIGSAVIAGLPIILILISIILIGIIDICITIKVIFSTLNSVDKKIKDMKERRNNKRIEKN